MFRFQFDCKSSRINTCALIFTGITLVLAIFGQINRINVIGAGYVMAMRLLGKIEHIRYALSIALTGCAYDLFYVCFHSSNSSWLYVRIIEFILHFLAFIFEIMWIMSVFCCLKQEETTGVSQNKVTWIGEQMDKVLPKIGNLIDTPANLMKLTSIKELVNDVAEAINNERSEIDTNLPSKNEPEQSTSSSEPLDESVAENVTDKNSLKEPTENDIIITNNIPVEKHFEPLPGDESKLDTKNDSQNKSEQASSLNETIDESIVNNETQPTSSSEPKKEDMAPSNDETLENNTVPSPEAKSENKTSKDS